MRANKYLYLFLIPSIIILLLITLFPLAYSLFISTHDASIVTRGNFIGINNYLQALTDLRFLHSLQIGFCFVLGATGLEFCFGLILALLLNSEVRGNNIMRTLFVFPMMITPVVVGIMWRILYDPDFGVLNYILQSIGLPEFPWLSSSATALIALILVDTWEWTPFMMLILLAGLKSLPYEPFEAAAIDGVSSWQKFIYITLPLLKSQILVATIIRMIDAFRAFDIFFVTTRGGPGKATEIASLYIYKVGFNFFHSGYAAALSIIFLLIILGIAIVYMKVESAGGSV